MKIFIFIFSFLVLCSCSNSSKKYAMMNQNGTVVQIDKELFKKVSPSAMQVFVEKVVFSPNQNFKMCRQGVCIRSKVLVINLETFSDDKIGEIRYLNNKLSLNLDFNKMHSARENDLLFLHEISGLF